MSRTQTEPEFSRKVAVEAVGQGDLVLEVIACDEERAALARRFDLLALDGLTANARLRMQPTDQLRLSVTFVADVLQSCVVTLESVATHLSERFEVVYAPESESDRDVEAVVDVNEEDPPEPLPGGQIDVGEMIAQHLAMAIDPYPRSAGAELGGEHAGDAAPSEQGADENPFAALQRLKSGS